MINLLKQLMELRELLTYIYQFIINRTIKDTDESLNEEGKIQGKVCEKGLRVSLLSLGTLLPPAPHIHSPGSSPNTLLLHVFL